jgi:DNA-binding phage protein
MSDSLRDAKAMLQRLNAWRQKSPHDSSLCALLADAIAVIRHADDGLEDAAEAHAAHQLNWIEEAAELRQRAEQAEAERDRLRAALKETVERFGPWHDGGCPTDDTCDCSAKPLHDRINAVLTRQPEDA